MHSAHAFTSRHARPLRIFSLSIHFFFFFSSYSLLFVRQYTCTTRLALFHDRSLRVPPFFEGGSSLRFGIVHSLFSFSIEKIDEYWYVSFVDNVTLSLSLSRVDIRNNKWEVIKSRLIKVYPRAIEEANLIVSEAAAIRGNDHPRYSDLDRVRYRGREDGQADRQTEGKRDWQAEGLGCRKDYDAAPVARAPFKTPWRGTTLVT